jgi:hypothetical protein
MVKDKKPVTWMKNHTLEGDGVLTGFYNHLWKRNKDFQSCKDVMCPDTIVYDHNFPRSWYTYDKKQKNLEKRQGRELDPNSIFERFSKSKDADVGILASYLYSYEDPTSGEAVTCVEFFNEKGLLEFVNRKVKREGILQKFVIPKGIHNSVIQAVWSPRICLVQRRMNINPIKDKLITERDPYSCAVTYEGPTHYSEESTCAIRTTSQIESVCLNIVDHFRNTEHKNITRMVVYFKVDYQDKLWLLWCGSLRVSDREQPSQMPVNLSPIFTSPAQTEGYSSPRGARVDISDKELHNMDLKHCEMTHDTIFKKNYVTSPRSANQSMHGGSTKMLSAREDTTHALEEPQQSSASIGLKSTQASHRQVSDNAAGRTAGDAEWYKVPGVQERYHELEAERDVVTSFMEDIFYEAYGHFLSHDPGPYTFEVERRVAQLIGMEVLTELMQHLRIDKAPQSDDPSALVDEELAFWIPQSSHSPVTKLSETAQRWLGQYYGGKEQALRDEAATIRVAMEARSAENPDGN